MAAPCTRFIADLTDDDREFLLKTWRTHDRHSVRCRAHAILLSAQEVSVPQLTLIFNIDDHTARSWLSRWEERGREGLEDAPRPGGPFKVDDAGRKLAIDLLHEHPNSPNTVIDKLEKPWKHVKYSELPAAAWRNLGTLVDNLTKAFTKLGRFVLMPSLASG